MINNLPKNTPLQGGKYRIEKVLGQGGFGITYLATQELLDRKVCIKEFFFKDSCSRNARGEVTLGTVGSRDMVKRFLNKFVKEAHTISKLEHPNIIRILDIFEENGTAYYVMEYIDGYSLADRVNQKGALSETEAVRYIKQVGSALEYIHHYYINHLDVKPANIMIRRSDNKAVLIDFGVSKQYDEQGGQTSTTPVGISHGYAPMEQYMVDGVKIFSPQTDIYSLGATLYNLLTGMIPPAPYQILDGGINIPNNVSQKLADAIRQAMQPNRSKRPTNIPAFVSLLRIDSCSFKDSMQRQTYFVDEETKINVQESRSVETEEDLRQRAFFIKKEIIYETKKWIYGWVSVSFIPFLFGFLLTDQTMFIILCSITFFNVIVGGIFLNIWVRRYIRNKSIEYKEKHPNDSVCKYLTKDFLFN